MISTYLLVFSFLPSPPSIHTNSINIFGIEHNMITSASMQRATILGIKCSRIVSEYDQEIPQSQTADNPVALRGRAAQPSRDTRKTN